MTPNHAGLLPPTADTHQVPGLGEARAYWLDPTTLAWPGHMLPPGVRYEDCIGEDGGRPATTPPVSFGLVCSPDGGIELSGGVLHRGEHGTEIPLGVAGLLPPEFVEAHPQLEGYLALTTRDEFGAPRLATEDVADLLTGDIVVVQRAIGLGSWVTACTRVQIWPLIDRLWGQAASRRDGSAPLGVRFIADADRGHSPHLTAALWAPTAQAVTLLTWHTGDPAGSVPLVAGEPLRTPATRLGDGRWEVSCGVGNEAALQEGDQYLWEVSVWVPASGRVETNVVTDPYARALTTDSRRCVAVNLDRPDLRPSRWRSTLAPVVTTDAARVIYELHLRDFSAADESVPEYLRGTYAALGVDSAGTRHLRELAHAGVDTIHLLPIFDFATVPEDRAEQVRPQIPGEAGPAGILQQDAIGMVRDRDAYNWGYDPWHWMAPEGSYARAGHQDGGARVVEVRDMVGAIHAMGLQVVLDQVYNHTAAAGQDAHSVLDRIVPGYYHRLDAAGAIETSACGTNTATERAMMERLLIDSCVSWVRDYRVDGFRFDLMGYHSTTTMARLREALAEVSEDAVGHDIYLYGEGWNMGEVAGNRLFRQAVQGQVGAQAGLGIGTFNDRIRDALMGNQFGTDPRVGQGLGSGLAGALSEHEERSAVEIAGDIAWRSAVLRLALAGNVRALALPDEGEGWRSGDGVSYGGGQVAYGDEPADSLAYVCSHDDETLWDRLAYKLPVDMPVAERLRWNNLCLAAVTLGQSPAFWPAGVEQLRSKSLDRDSYNSGDWFNAIDWSGHDNGWGRGLPPSWHNFERWVIQADLLTREQLRPARAEIARARAVSLEWLRLRRSTPLLTLGSAALVRERVSFPRCHWVSEEGHAGLPEGVILMVIDDGAGEGDLDPALDGVMVALNMRTEAVQVRVEDLVGRDFVLSDIQAESADPVVCTTYFEPGSGVLNIPGVSAAVLVEC